MWVKYVIFQIDRCSALTNNFQVYRVSKHSLKSLYQIFKYFILSKIIYSLIPIKFMYLIFEYSPHTIHNTFSRTCLPSYRILAITILSFNYENRRSNTFVCLCIFTIMKIQQLYNPQYDENTSESTRREETRWANQPLYRHPTWAHVCDLRCRAGKDKMQRPVNYNTWRCSRCTFKGKMVNT